MRAGPAAGSKAPDLPRLGAVLAAITDAASRAKGTVAHEAAGTLDRARARRPGTVQAGTKKRRAAEPTISPGEHG